MKTILKNTNSLHKTQSGFTLLELMLTLTIAGILAMIAIPSMNYALNNSRVKTASTETFISLLLARSEAITRNDDVILEPVDTADWMKGWKLKCTTASAVCVSPFELANLGAFPGATIVCRYGAVVCPGNITFTNTGRPKNRIEFWIYSNSNPDIPIRCVKVSLSGRPRVFFDSNNDLADGCG